jgi:hypothetical protein
MRKTYVTYLRCISAATVIATSASVVLQNYVINWSGPGF